MDTRDKMVSMTVARRMRLVANPRSPQPIRAWFTFVFDTITHGRLLLNVSQLLPRCLCAKFTLLEQTILLLLPVFHPSDKAQQARYAQMHCAWAFLFFQEIQ